jgi:hypothetical protein
MTIEPVRVTDFLLYGLKSIGVLLAVALMIGIPAGLLAAPRALTIGAAVVVALALLSRVSPPGAKGEPRIPSEERSPGLPLAWNLKAPSGIGLDEGIERVESIGLRLESAAGAGAQLAGGSQLRSRLLGGYFVDPARLPITVTILPGPHGTLTVQVRDRMGPIAVRDPALESRYALRVAQIQDALAR